MRLFLLDTMGSIFRAYHQPQTQRFYTSQGLPTGGVFVFHNMLRKLLEEQKPEHIVAVFDAAAPTFRDELFVEYKANRAAMPEELARQLPYIHKLLEALRVPTLEAPGFEADDLIATLAAAGARAGLDVTIVTSDKDMRQMVAPPGKYGPGSVTIFDPVKEVVYDVEKIRELMGVEPEQVADVMALQGDAIDNIPGAPGIGEKGARDLIQRFGSVEAALERASEVQRKTYRESLEKNRDLILMSKKLATLDAGAPVELNLESLRAQEPDHAALREIYRELEFHSLLRETLPAMETAGRDYAELGAGGWGPGAGEGPVALVVAGYEAQAFLALSPRPGLARTLPAERLAEVRELLEDPARPKAVHDAKAALAALRRHSIELRGVEHDTLLYAYLLDPTETSYELEKLGARHFGARLSGSPAESADVLGQMAPRLAERVEQEGLGSLYRTAELPLVPVLADMEAAGVLVDVEELARLSEQVGRHLDELTAEIYRLCGTEFNINSPQQLSHVLFDKLNLPQPVKYGRGKVRSTAADVLEDLAESFDVPRKVLEYRQLAKLKGTYIDALPSLAGADGRLHTSFHQAGTATGRLSSSDPNLQNIPIRSELGREIRAAFVAQPGWLIVSADYSQIELRLLAHLSQDPVLLEAFARGEDIHAHTAELVFGVPPLMQTAEHRRRAKVINFGIVYGLSAFGLAQQLGIDKGEAQQFIEEYFARYKGVKQYIQKCLEEARKTGVVRTILGRRRPIPDIGSRNANLRGFAERTAINTPLQGSAADLIKLAMIRIHRELKERGLRSRMLLQVHDELVLEAPEAELEDVRRLTKTAMEQAQKLSVPLVVEVGVGRNWREVK